MEKGYETQIKSNELVYKKRTQDVTLDYKNSQQPLQQLPNPPLKTIYTNKH